MQTTTTHTAERRGDGLAGWGVERKKDEEDEERAKGVGLGPYYRWWRGSLALDIDGDRAKKEAEESQRRKVRSVHTSVCHVCLCLMLALTPFGLLPPQIPTHPILSHQPSTDLLLPPQPSGQALPVGPVHQRSTSRPPTSLAHSISYFI